MNLDPFIEVCEEHGVAWRNVAENHGLPRDGTAGIRWIPTQFAMSFVHELATITGEPLGRLAGERYDLAKLNPLIAEELAQAGGLEQAFELVMKHFPDSSNDTLLWPEKVDGQWMLCFRAIYPITLAGASHAEWFRLIVLMSLFRPFLPKGWQPKELWLCSPPPKKPLPSYLSKTKVRYSAPHSAFPLPFAEGYCPFVAPSEPSAWLDSLLALASTYAGMPEFSVHWLSRLTNTTPRTLQRQLKKHGLHFNQVRNEARYSQAKALLSSTEMTVMEIAWRTGYSDSANFNRAFRAWAGVTARQYREQHSRSRKATGYQSPSGHQ
ncbi:AraC-type DNA-binding protein [Ferrimonas marina]|uniref:AraC-type DNA-binding protein n=2 Tax=Ferrimonas marina TaxID=299255 RepID=A0A1M5P6Y0_9GAMM|nr:AraC-type DNA-binding protein [Ferrimonas marina]